MFFYVVKGLEKYNLKTILQWILVISINLSPNLKKPKFIILNVFLKHVLFQNAIAFIFNDYILDKYLKSVSCFATSILKSYGSYVKEYKLMLVPLVDLNILSLLFKENNM